MRRLIALGAVVLALTGFTMLAPYIPAAPTVKYHITGRVATCVVTWADTTTTVVRSEVRRRSILADTAVGGRKSDTVWQSRGYAGAGAGTTGLRDACAFGRTYRYQVRDSIPTVAFSAWGDSTTVTVPTRKY